MGTKQPDYQDDILVEIDEKTTEPPMYKVLLHNDDYTTKALLSKF